MFASACFIIILCFIVVALTTYCLILFQRCSPISSGVERSCCMLFRIFRRKDYYEDALKRRSIEEDKPYESLRFTKVKNLQGSLQQHLPNRHLCAKCHISLQGSGQSASIDERKSRNDEAVVEIKTLTRKQGGQALRLIANKEEEDQPKNYQSPSVHHGDEIIDDDKDYIPMGELKTLKKF